MAAVHLTVIIAIALIPDPQCSKTQRTAAAFPVTEAGNRPRRLGAEEDATDDDDDDDVENKK